MVDHPDDMCYPWKLGLDEYGFNAGTLRTVQDLEICDPSHTVYMILLSVP